MTISLSKPNRRGAPGALRMPVFAFVTGAAGRPVHVLWVQLGVMATLVFVVPFLAVVDPDFWWHLRTGQLIFEQGLPRHDPFSWTALGNEWVAHEWLSEVIIYAVERWTGYAGNVALFSSATLAALALMFATARRLGTGSRALVLIGIPVAATMAGFVTVRPQVFTWLLFAIFVYVIVRAEEGKRAPLWLLPALTALWVNLHLGFFYGLLAVGAWMVSRTVQRLRGQPADVLTPIWVAGACLAVTNLNPNGPTVLWYPFRYLQDADALRIVDEWRRPDFTSPFNLPLLALSVSMAAALMSRGRPGQYLWLVSLAALVLSMQALRNAPFIALLAAPVIGPALAGKWRWARISGDTATVMPAGIAAACVIAVGALVLGAGALSGASTSGWSPSARDYPEQGVEYLRRSGQDARLFNDYGWGGYLIQNLWPNVPVFVDGRTDFYRSELLDDYIAIMETAPGWQAILDAYGVDTALLRSESHLAEVLRQEPGWAEIFAGEIESVFVRR